MLYLLMILILYLSPLQAKIENPNMKMVGDLENAFGSRLKEMRILEIGGNLTQEICGCASYTDNPDKAKECDLFICCNPDFINSEFLKQAIYMAPYGYLSYNTQNNINEIISTLLKSGKKGTLIQSERDLEKLTLIWKPTREKHISILNEIKNDDSAITYDFSGGRLGDNLLSYFHAKWLSHEYGIPFLYRPFQYSECFLLCTKDKPISSSFANTLRLSEKIQILDIKPSTLVVVPYFTESKFEYEMLNHAKEKAPYYLVDWEDPDFQQEIRNCLTPTIPVDYISLPKDKLTVAVHVRRGGEIETYAQGAQGYPLKFPPDSFYIDQIRRIADIYKDKSIYVYIFTDAKQPHKIAQAFTKALKDKRIKIDCKQEIKRSKGASALLNDFFSMGKFDCLIRSMSNFSVVASLLGDYSLMIYPTHAHFERRKVVIDEIEIKFKDKQ